MALACNGSEPRGGARMLCNDTCSLSSQALYALYRLARAKAVASRKPSGRASHRPCLSPHRLLYFMRILSTQVVERCAQISSFLAAAPVSQDTPFQ